MSRIFSVFSWLVLACLGLLAGTAAAQQPQQAPRAGSLHLTIRDATDLTVEGAELTLTDASGAERVGRANDRGEVIFEGLAAGVYAVHVTSPGFTALEIKDLRVRAGAATTRAVVLQIAGLMERKSTSRRLMKTGSSLARSSTN